jgi:hypothetical protein
LLRRVWIGESGHGRDGRLVDCDGLVIETVKVAQYLRTKKSENSNFNKNHSDFQVPTRELTSPTYG